MIWPQITVIVLMSIRVAVNIALHGKPRPEYNLWHSLINAAILTGLLYAGGFWAALQ